MSALTKVFVVLLVVLSLILSAGLIVFVNRQDNFRVSADEMKKKLSIQQEKATALGQEIQKVRSQLDAGMAAKDTQITALRTEVQTRDKTIADKDTQLADAQQQLTQTNAANVSLAEGLKVAQAQIASTQTGYNALLGDSDKNRKEIVEDSNRITELTNSLEVTSKHDRYMAEQNTQLSQQLTSAQELLRKYGISPTGSPAPVGGAINSTPTININGVVRDFKTINGVPYATISLGSAEAVTRGMQFKVIDPQRNQFLGYLTIDSVQAHEATGHLEGPAVSQVHPNVTEVRTQL